MKALVSLAILLAASVASAESLEERTFWKAQADEVNDSIAKGEQRCGVTLELESVDKDQLRAALEKTRWTPGQMCDVVLYEAVRLCGEGDKPKAAVAAKIKRFRCGFAKDRKLTLQSGLVADKINPAQPSPEQWAREQLLARLPRSANVPGPH